MAQQPDTNTGKLFADISDDNAAVAEKPGQETLLAKVWSPFRVYFNGRAKSISAVNGTGPFDVLPRHHNFITLLNRCDLKLQTGSGETTIKISGGVMHVHKNTVTVFLEV
jgi:F0F1-type ATP synthase epsilon subunit